MKTRRSTAILLTVWVATFVLYLFVKPETPQTTGYSPIMNTMLSNYLPDEENPQQR
ncbi:hypothetical protein [Nocardia huaxiensis]|uniref:Uncharacterized protein n=1 Tax=Nocardia huaxiensis TaxID=2755382 RepID=A0A7D6Z8D9_9NOCA|nr:hypothetical protein [Nocardia huaxiensis]QLY27538.1 hypothetical protein H0264_13145 [Nocardia huaxiensis]UFS93187.1 hypothetical protein LPY97_20215 [Nocardia huaxiensis]